jgi:hypothetical protein
VFNRPRLSTLTYLAFQIVAAIDEGHEDKFSFQEIYQSLERRSLLQDLSHKLPEVFDLGLIMGDDEQRRGLMKVLAEASEVFRSREKCKAGVERSGLTLLMAIILEAIQQQNWTTPSLNPLSPDEVASFRGSRNLSVPTKLHSNSFAFSVGCCCGGYGSPN